MRVLLCFVFVFLFDTFAHAQLPKYIQDLRKVSAFKKDSRWTLADWLSTKSKVKAMDNWLALNRSVQFFELFFGAGYGQYNMNYDGVPNISESDKVVKTGNVGFFLTIFGAEAQYEVLEDETEIQRGLGYLRIWGNAHQSSHLTLHYGLRRWEVSATQSHFENVVYGAELQLYMLKSFGLRGMYRQIEEASADDDRKLGGTRWEAGAFIEALWLRVYANLYEENLNFDSSGSNQVLKRSGLDAGVAFYF